jgi:hypothetical protein
VVERAPQDLEQVGLSAVAGIAFVVQAGAAHPSLSNLAGCALLGGILFLVSALRLRRTN